VATSANYPFCVPVDTITAESDITLNRYFRFENIRSDFDVITTTGAPTASA